MQGANEIFQSIDFLELDQTGICQQEVEMIEKSTAPADSVWNSWEVIFAFFDWTVSTKWITCFHSINSLQSNYFGNNVFPEDLSEGCSMSLINEYSPSSLLSSNLSTNQPEIMAIASQVESDYNTTLFDEDIRNMLAKEDGKGKIDYIQCGLRI
jgi:hypothetical protein